jgi:uncharacterized protein (TIGR03435 family)
MQRRLLAVIVLSGVGLAAQTAPPALVTPAWDAVVIKRNTSGDDSMSAGSRPGGSYVMVNGSMRTLFGNAYPSQSGEIINMPDWFQTERYDLTARMIGNPTLEQRQALWRELFTERMKLKVHYEDREQPTYDLVLARADGRLGPNIKPSQVDCAARSAAAGRGETLPPLPAIPPGGAPACGMMSGPDGVRAGGTTLAGLARSIPAGRLVIDKTGLNGSYDLTLEFSSRRGPDAATDDRPTIFTALQEQLGLKLEPSRNPVQFAVIDSVERPIVD